MRFREWLKIDEISSPYRRSPRASSLSFPRTSPRTDITGHGGYYGNYNRPGILATAGTAVASGAGDSLRGSLEKMGLNVQGARQVASLPRGLLDSEESEPKHYTLPLQIPVQEHNGQEIEHEIARVLEPRAYVTSKRLYERVLVRDVDLRLIRHERDGFQIKVPNKFLLLNVNDDEKEEGDEDNEEVTNWDVNESRQFTRALIYKCIVEEMNKNRQERMKYDIKKFYEVHEDEKNGMLTVHFVFEPNKSIIKSVARGVL